MKMGAKKQQIFSDLLLVCRCDGRCVIQLLAVKVKLEQAFYQLLNDMLLHFHIDMTVYFGIGADISGVMGKDSSNGFRVALACLVYRFIGGVAGSWCKFSSSARSCCKIICMRRPVVLRVRPYCLPISLWVKRWK